MAMNNMITETMRDQLALFILIFFNMIDLWQIIIYTRNNEKKHYIISSCVI